MKDDGRPVASLGRTMKLGFAFAALFATVAACQSAPHPAAGSSSQTAAGGSQPAAAAPSAATAPVEPAAPAAAPVEPAAPSTARSAGAEPARAPRLSPELSFPRRVPISVSVLIPSLSEPVPNLRAAAPAAQIAAAPAAPATPPAAAATPPPAAPTPAQASTKPATAPAAQSAPPKKSATAAPAAAKTTKPKAAAPSATVVPVIKPALPLAPPSSEEIVLPSAEPNPSISRNVSAMVGERIEIPFDGSGWTYLGEKDGKDGVTYETRRFEGSGAVFVMLASKAGDYVLRFQRQDVLRGLTSTELIGASVKNRPTVVASPQTAAGGETALPGATPVEAPSAQAALVAPSAVAGAVSPAAGSPAASPSDANAQSASAASAVPPPDPNSPEGMLLAAKNELGAGRVQSALDQLDRLLAKYPAGSDEVFYTYALALEQNGPLKDIRRAYDLYKKVRDEYPESPFWDKANDRISYIERHYFEIR